LLFHNQLHMTKKIVYISLISVLVLTLTWMNGCTPENEETSGVFSVRVTGDIQEEMEGDATFDLLPKDQYSYVIIRLEEDDLNYVRLSFINTSSTTIHLEPGEYNIVPQIAVNNQKEVLVDYFNDGIKYIGNSGSVSLGISKEAQLKGTINNANFPDINSLMSGNYDAKRK